MPVVQGKPRRFQQRRNLRPAISAAAQPDHESPRQASPIASLTMLQQALPQSEDDLSDVCSAAGSETSLDLDSDSEDDPDDSSEGSNDDSSDNGSLDGEKAVGPRVSHLERIAQYEEEGPTLANRGDSAKKMIRTEQGKWIE